MKRKNKTALFAALFLTGLLLVPLASVALAGEDGHRCRFEGTWFTRIGPNWLYETVTSLDSSNNFVSIVMDRVLLDPTYSGMFPDVTGVTPFRGEGVRTGRRSFEYKFVAYGVAPAVPPPGQEVKYIVVAFGEKDFAEDCQSYEVSSTGEVYGANADQDSDGLPDPDQVPVIPAGPPSVIQLYRLSMD